MTGPRNHPTERFDVGECLGAGSSGIVFDAFDKVRRRSVALKRLREPSPEAVRMLKREFRVVCRFAHPNLVALYDLFVSDEGGAFFTMERIEGLSLQGWAAAHGDDSDFVERVAGIFQGIAAGLDALHAGGVNHRDLKPSNVLVRPDGEPVLLDFGLATRLSLAVSQNSRAGTFAGSYAYAAPEQVFGGELSAASDWYAFGVMLYEVLTRRLPLDEAEIFRGPNRALPPPPSTLRAGLPAELDQLVLALMQPRPADRAGADEVREVLRSLDSRKTAFSPELDLQLVGRGREIEALRAFTETPRNGLGTVFVRGASGVGKSTLVETHCRQLEQAGYVVLRGTCHPREHVRFNAFDGLVDNLVRVLADWEGAERRSCAPRRLSALEAMFPAFREVDWSSETRPTSSRRPLTSTSREDHLAARDAFVELMERTSLAKPLALFIDDFQWADADSLDLVDALGREISTNVLLFATVRDDARSHTRDRGAGALTIEVAPLDADARQRLGAALAAHLQLPPATGSRVAELGGGNPLVTKVVAHHVATIAEVPRDFQMHNLVGARFEAASEPERRLLTMISCAIGPLPGRVIEAVWEGEPVDAVCRKLEQQQLAALEVGDDDWFVGPYHALVGEALTAAVEASRTELAPIHRSLARAFDNERPEAVLAAIHHHLAAGDRGRAVERALYGADAAMRSLAYHQAASLYRRVIDLGGGGLPSWHLQDRLGEALIGAGHAVEGASFVLRAARLREEVGAASDPSVVTNRMRFAAEHLLRGGAREAGIRAMREVTARVGLSWRRTLPETLASIGAHSLLLAAQRRLTRNASGASKARGSARRRDIERLDVCWSAGVGLSHFDSIRAFDFQVRHARLAEVVAEPGHLALAHATEAMIRSLDGPREAARSQGLMALARQFSGRAASPQVEAHVRLMEASCSYSEWRYEKTLELCRAIDEFCREHGGRLRWERAYATWLRACALGKLGRYDIQRHAAQRALEDATRRGDVYQTILLALGPAMMHRLAWDEAETALQDADDARDRSGESGFLAYLHTTATVRALLYRGDVAKALARARSGMAEVKRLGMFDKALIRIEMLEARCAAELAAIASGRAGRASTFRALRLAYRRLIDDNHPAARAKGLFARGQLHLLSGNPGAAESDLERAVLALDAVGETILQQAAQAMVRVARRNDAGEARTFHTWLEARDVAHPRRLAFAIAPALAAS